MNRPTPDTTQRSAPRPIREMLQDCKEIARTEPGDAHRIGSLLQEMIVRYYGDVRSQAQHSFLAALVVATVGVLLFIGAIWLAMLSGDKAKAGVVAGVAGGLMEFISGINFYLYLRAARQFASFHVCLERTNRFLLANTLCEKLSEPARDEMRRELVRIVATAPMLSLDIVTGEQRLGRVHKQAARGPNKPLQPTPTSGVGAAG